MRGNVNHTVSSQSGVALVISLVLLLVITLICITGLTNGAMQQKMAANAQQSNQVFQNAEGAVSHAMVLINGLKDVAGSSAKLSQAMADGAAIKVDDPQLSKNGLMAVSVTYTYQAHSGLKPGVSLNADENEIMIGEKRFKLQGRATMASSGATSVVNQGISYE